jgi:uncharacterized protein YijF (DUF1287 family)
MERRGASTSRIAVRCVLAGRQAVASRVATLLASAVIAATAATSIHAQPDSSASARPAVTKDFVGRLLEGARGQIGVTLIYDGTYRRLDYPCGDVPPERGVCTDVLVRAFRRAGVDLQALVHQDMRAAFDHYPQSWGLTRPDRNIDHRRVPNLVTFFRRQGASVASSSRAEDYRAGDIVAWRLPSGLPHIGIVAAEREGERPLVYHNIGAGAKLEDVLFAYERTAHFRWLPAAPADSAICARASAPSL